MPRDIRISAEVAELVDELAPEALRQVVESADHEDVYCVISARMLPPSVPVAILAFRDPIAGQPWVEVRCADAKLHESAVIERPGLREGGLPVMASQEQGITWRPFHHEGVAGIAFEPWVRYFLPTGPGEDPHDAQRVFFEQRGWREPAVGLPHDPLATVILCTDKFVLSLHDQPGAFEFPLLDEPLAPEWLEVARRQGRVAVLYGCATDRLLEAIGLGDVVGAMVGFSDGTLGRWRPRLLRTPRFLSSDGRTQSWCMSCAGEPATIRAISETPPTSPLPARIRSYVRHR